MIGAVMTGGELAIVIAGTRGDWPGGPRTLTPREPRPCEPNAGRTLWFGAELDPDGRQQVWFRIAEESPSPGCRREDARTTAAHLLVDALIFWITPDRALQPGINRFEVRVWRCRRHVARTAAVA